MECVSWKIEVVNELTEGTGIKILSSKQMLQRLFFIAQTIWVLSIQ